MLGPFLLVALQLLGQPQVLFLAGAARARARDRVCLDRASFDGTKDLSRFTDNERASYQRYGYRYTGDAYAPHMTLGRAPEEVALDLVRTAPERVVALPKEWVFDRLSVYVMGQHGAHAETLLERPLAGR